MKRKQQKDESETETTLIPPSEESEGLELDPGCNDEEAPSITMMSERGRRNAARVGAVVNWRNTTIRRTP